MLRTIEADLSIRKLAGGPLQMLMTSGENGDFTTSRFVSG